MRKSEMSCDFTMVEENILNQVHGISPIYYEGDTLRENN